MEDGEPPTLDGGGMILFWCLIVAIGIAYIGYDALT